MLNARGEQHWPYKVTYGGQPEECGNDPKKQDRFLYWLSSLGLRGVFGDSLAGHEVTAFRHSPRAGVNVSGHGSFAKAVSWHGRKGRRGTAQCAFLRGKRIGAGGDNPARLLIY